MLPIYRLKIRLALFSLILLMSRPALCSPWEGLYLGGFIGGAWGTFKSEVSTSSSSATPYFSSAADSDAVNQKGTLSLKPKSFIKGLKAGNDWVSENIVLGVVLDFSTFHQESAVNESGAYPSGAGNYSLQMSFYTDWLFTLRTRGGLQVDNAWLFYATLGAAITKLNIVSNFSDDSQATGSNFLSAHQIGWTIGVGAEFMVAEALSVSAEYLSINIPIANTSGTITNTSGGFGVPAGALSSPFSTSLDSHSSLLRFGMNYRF